MIPPGGSPAPTIATDPDVQERAGSVRIWQTGAGGTDVITRERFEQGLTARQYLEQMDLNRERFVRALDAVTLRPEDMQALERSGATRKILVITEDWCGTSLAVLPYVFKLAETDPRVDLRVFLRDQNPDLMDQYLKDGRHRSIPVIVFLDEALAELARFIERRPA
jgi:Thioredoxin